MRSLLIAYVLLIVAVLFAGTAARADVVELTKRDSNTPGYFYTETIADGLTGNDVKIFPLGYQGGQVTCRIIAGAGTGKFQFTTSSDGAVIAQTAVWSDWPKGTITGTEWDALMSQVSGLRGVSTSGEVTIEILY